MINYTNTVFNFRSTCRILTLFLCITCLPTFCFAHNEKLHEEITKAAFKSSEGLTNFLSDFIGNDNAPFNTDPTLDSPFIYAGSTYTTEDLLAQGSYKEDMTFYGKSPLYQTWRSLDHFYAPLPTVHGLSDNSESPVLVLKKLPSGIVDSFTWATTKGISGVSTVSVHFTNTETWPDARSFQYLALTSTNKTDRNVSMAHMLYTLGHVLHLNQDTSSPDHVRNNSHNEKAYFEDFGRDTYLVNANANPTALATSFPLRPRGWASWKSAGFQKLEDFWNRHLYSGGAQALNDDANSVSGKQLGLAEFNNGNFVGEKALYKEYFTDNTNDIYYFPFPSLHTSTDFPTVRSHLATGVKTTFLKNGKAISRIFIDKTGDGITLSNHSVLNYLGTVSPRQSGVIARVSSTINDPAVLQAYHEILIPKAIEYSAGMLDYFFRGNLSIALTGNASSTFSLNITNLSGQDLIGGQFQLFYDDSSGVRTPLSSSSFSTSYLGELADSNAISAIFVAPTNAVRFILVYQGTIGPSAGTLDPVDINIAIAAKSFTLPTIAGSLPTGQIGTSYSSSITSTGIQSPSFSIIGTLPDGLSMNSSGNITGTPTTAESAVFAVDVTDGVTSAQFTKDFAISITDASGTPCGTAQSWVSSLAIQLPSLTDTVIDDSFVIFVEDNSSPFSCGGSPNGRYNWYNNYETTASPSYVNLHPTAAYSGSSFELVINGGLGFKSVAFITNGFNADIHMDCSSLVGINTAGTTISMSGCLGPLDSPTSNPGGPPASPGTLSPFTFSAILDQTLAQGTASNSYSQSVTGLGFSSPAFTLASGAFPDGLSMDAGGIVTGTPTMGGTNTAVVLVTDTTTSFACEVSVHITVAGFVANTLASGTVGAGYDGQIVTSGFNSPTFTLISGSFADGLSMSSSGLVTGTPTTVQATTANVSVSDGTTSVSGPIYITINGNGGQ